MVHIRQKVALERALFQEIITHFGQIWGEETFPDGNPKLITCLLSPYLKDLMLSLHRIESDLEKTNSFKVNSEDLAYVVNCISSACSKPFYGDVFKQVLLEIQKDRFDTAYAILQEHDLVDNQVAEIISKTAEQKAPLYSFNDKVLNPARIWVQIFTEIPNLSSPVDQGIPLFEGFNAAFKSFTHSYRTESGKETTLSRIIGAFERTARTAADTIDNTDNKTICDAMKKSGFDEAFRNFRHFVNYDTRLTEKAQAVCKLHEGEKRQSERVI